MSGRVVGRVFERVLGNAPEKAVLTCLAEHSNPDGEMAFPSVWRIAQETELGESTVRAALGRLRSRHLITQTHAPAGHRPATYRVCLDTLADLQLVEVYRPGFIPGLHQEAPDLQEPEVTPLAGGARPPGGSARPLAPGPEPSLTVHREPSEEPSRTSASRPPSHDQTPWVQILTLLRRGMDRAEFDTWVQPTELLSLAGDVLTIGAASSFGVERLQSKHREEIEAAAREVLGRPVRARFVVATKEAA